MLIIKDIEGLAIELYSLEPIYTYKRHPWRRVGSFSPPRTNRLYLVSPVQD